LAKNIEQRKPLKKNFVEKTFLKNIFAMKKTEEKTFARAFQKWHTMRKTGIFLFF